MRTEPAPVHFHNAQTTFNRIFRDMYHVMTVSFFQCSHEVTVQIDIIFLSI